MRNRLMLFLCILLSFCGAEVFADCVSPVAKTGSIEFNSVTKTSEYCNGTDWISMKFGGADIQEVLVDPSTYQFGSASAMHSDGDTVYVASDGVVYILDTTDVNNVFVVNSFSHPSMSGSMNFTQDGDTLYVSMSNNIFAYDITIRNSPIFLGTIYNTSLGNISNIHAKNGYIFAVKTGGVSIVDFVNPSAPLYLQTFTEARIPSVANESFLSGNYLYMTFASNDRLTIIDVTSETSPVVTGTIVDSVKLNGASSIVVTGNHAFVGAGNSYLFTVIDISDKAAPFYVTDINGGVNGLFDDSKSFVLYGNYVFTANHTGSSGGSYLVTVDISNPVEPRVVFVHDIEGGFPPGIQRLSLGNKLAAIKTGVPGIAFYDLAPRPIAFNEPDRVLFSGNGNYQNYAVANGNLLVTAANESLYVYDITNPTIPVALGAARTSSSINIYGSSLAFDGYYAYLSNGNSGPLFIFDIGTNPSKPKLISKVSSLGTIRKVLYDNNYIYATGGYNNKISIVDVSNRLKPSIVGSYTDATYLGGAYSLFLEGNYLYVSGNSAKSMAIIDITDKTNPVFVSGLVDATNFAGATGIAKKGNYVYLQAQTANAFNVIDVSTITSPILVSTNTDPMYYDYGYDLEIYNDFMVLTSFGSGTVLLDLTDPSAPVPLSKISGNRPSVAIKGNYLYVGTASTNMMIHDITNKSSPSSVGSFSYTNYLSNVNAFQKVGNYGLATKENSSTITIIDMSDNLEPGFLSPFVDAINITSPKDIVVSGSYAYVAGANHLSVFNISSLPAISFTGKITDAVNIGTPSRIYVDGDYVYLLSSSLDRIVVIDVTNKTSPIVTGVLSDTRLDNPYDIKKSGDHLFVTSNTADSFCAIDVSSPSSPIISSCYQNAPTFDSPKGVLVKGSKAFVAFSSASTQDTVIIFDISNPASLLISGTLKLNTPTEFTLSGETIFHTADSGKMYGQFIFDSTLRVKPQASSGRFHGASSLQRLYAYGNYLYGVGRYSDTIAIINISNKSLPSCVDDHFFTGNSFYQISDSALDNNNLYTVSSGGQMTKIDVSNPASPVLVDSVHSLDLFGSSAIAVKDDYAYTAWGGRYIVSAFNISNFANPTLFSKKYSSTYYSGVSKLLINGNYLFAMGSGGQTITSFDISNPGDLVVAQNFRDTTNFSNLGDMVIQGNYLYTCSTLSASRINVVDIANPSAMTIVGSLVDSTNLGSCTSLFVNGNYLYFISKNNDRFTIVDISNPNLPAVVSSITDAVDLNYVSEIYIDGNYAVLSSSTMLLTLVDVSNKSAPFINSSHLKSFGSTLSIDTSYKVGDYFFRFALKSTSGSLIATQIEPEINLGPCSFEGQISWNSVEKVMAFCNGSTFKGMGAIPGAGGSGCSGPTSAAGALEYNLGTNKFQYCDGASWIEI